MKSFYAPLFSALFTAALADTSPSSIYSLPVAPKANRNAPGVIDTLAPGTNLSAAITTLYEQTLAKGNAPSGALWLLKEGTGEQLLMSFGDQSLDANSGPYRLDNHFRIGSITKTFTGTAILQLVQEGKLSLDDTWSNFYDASLGDFPYAQNITVRHMLSQTSGVPEYIFSPNGGYDPVIRTAPYNFTYEDTVRLILERQPYFFPGDTKAFNYTNSNFVMLGERIVEQVAQMPWREYFRTKVVAPAGLRDTVVPAVGQTNVPAPAPRHYAYRALNVTTPTADDMTKLIDYTIIDPSSWGSAGSFISTFKDLRKWVCALANGNGFSDNLKAERLTDNLHPYPRDLGAVKFDYGLGIMKINGYYGHIGDVVGASTYMFHDPTKKNTIIFVATNGPSAIALPDALKIMALFDPSGFGQ